MRIVITGGSGLIGRALSANLSGEGHEVTVLSRRPVDHADALPRGVRLAAWDPRAPEGLSAALAGSEVVVNLAGASIAEGRWTEARKAIIRSSRLRSAQALVEAISAMAQKPRVFVQAAAVGIYGTQQAGPLDETSPPGDDFLARTCVEWEASTLALEGLGLRRIVTRTGIVLSREGGALPRMLLPFRLFAGGPLGSGHQPFPWIHLQDVVGAMRFLMADEQASGAYNLTAPQALDNAAFSRLLGQVMQRPSWLPAPAFALKAAFGEMASLLLDGQQAVPARLLAAGYPFRFPEAEQALRDLLAD